MYLARAAVQLLGWSFTDYAIRQPNKVAHAFGQFRQLRSSECSGLLGTTAKPKVISFVDRKTVDFMRF
jgi:hypothetical protein